MPDPAPLSLVCLSPATPTRGEDLIVTFRVPPVQFSEGLEWSILIEQKQGGEWVTAALVNGAFATDLEVQRLRCPDTRFIRLTLTYQGSPVVLELETHEIARPPHPNAWLSRKLADEPCPWKIYYGRVYSGTVEVDHLITGYYSPSQSSSAVWEAVKPDGSGDRTRPFGLRQFVLAELYDTNKRVVVATSPLGTAEAPLAVSYQLDDLTVVVSSVIAPESML